VALPFAGRTHTSLDAELVSVVCDRVLVDIPFLAAMLQAAVPIRKLERWLAFMLAAPCIGARLKYLRSKPSCFSVM
jgi:hypothetical protein